MICTTGHQPNMYPYGGFFSKAVNADIFVIADNTQYVKKQYHNRNRVRLSSGQVVWLSVPVKNAGNFRQLICEVEIDNRQPWAKKHRRTLELNYKKAPFFDEYYPQIEELLCRDWQMLSKFNCTFIKLCFKLLNIDMPVYTTSELGASGKATELILDICKKSGADSYLHGYHSCDYVDFKMLSDAGITNFLQDFRAEPYTQVAGGKFEGNLSILDMIFNLGQDSAEFIRTSTTVTQV